MASIAPPVLTSPDRAWRRRWRWRTLYLVVGLLLFILAWLIVAVPVSRTERVQGVESTALVSADGETFFRSGGQVGEPVDVRRLPAHVEQAFLAIEDRRFRSHLGVDPRGLARATVRNIGAGGLVEGGSTITQQLAKITYLESDRNLFRKAQEAAIALWLELWLAKDQILSRYLSNVYLGDNVYGLDAAARHYFGRAPENLTTAQAAMLAGLVKAPSRLNPNRDLEAAQARSRLVFAAMVDAGYLDADEAEDMRAARPVRRRRADVANAGYFADHVLRALPADQRQGAAIATTLDTRLQAMAERAVRGAPLGSAQVALVAMRPDGRVVAMIGGRDHRRSAFNRVTQARRQPGSTFKLFVYLAALREGFTPDDMVADAPLALGGWTPRNADGRYRGLINLREAFADSVNTAAVRMSEEVGRGDVIRAARDLGIESPLADAPSLALGTSGVTLLEMTGAYVAAARGAYPVRPRFAGPASEAEITAMDRQQWAMLLDMLWSATHLGTGVRAALPVPSFGKTGTTQDNRDGIFIGFSQDLITGIWVGHDDNRPLPSRMAGGRMPARIWNAFMTDAWQAGLLQDR